MLIWILSLNLKLKQKLKQRRMKKMEQKEKILLGKTEEDEKPPYPDEPNKKGFQQFTDRVVEEPGKIEQQINIDAKQLCQDIVRAGFVTAHVINKKVREGTEKEIRDIGLPLANVLEKYNLLQYAKYASYLQELQLAYNLYSAVIVRVKEVREDKRVDVET
jgi:hypothetical protein